MRSTFSTAAALTAMFGMLVLVGGCDSSVGTAVAITGGAAAATVLGSQAATGSTITVTVDSFDDTGLSGFDLDERCALTPEKVQSLHEKLKPFIDQLGEGQKSVTKTRDLFKKLPDDARGAPQIARDLTTQLGLTEGVLNAWGTFDSQLAAAKSDGRIRERELPILAQKLRDLRAAAVNLAGHKASKAYFNYLCTDLLNALADDIDVLGLRYDRGVEEAWKDLCSKVQLLKKEDGSTENVAKLLGLIATVVWKIQDLKSPTDNIQNTLPTYGLPPEAIEKPSANGEGDANAAVLPTQQIAAILRSQKFAGPWDQADAANGILDALPNQITTSVSSGPIRDEAMQTLTTGRAIDTIMNPKNKPLWRETFSKAESLGNTGNHNALIYFENMARPVLKSSVFDPTKFIVADGLLFRKAFAAASSIYGMPGGNPLAGDKGVVPRLHTMGAATQLADRKTKAAQDSIKNAVDGTTTLQDGSKAKLDAFKAAREKCQDTNAAANAAVGKAEQAEGKAESAAKEAASQSTASAEAASRSTAAAEAATKAGVDPNTLPSIAQTAAENASKAVEQAKAAVSQADIAAESAGTTKVSDATKKAVDEADAAAKDARDKAGDPKQAKDAAKKAGEAATKAAQAATEALATANKAVQAAKKAVASATSALGTAKAALDKQAKDRAEYIDNMRKQILSTAAELEGAGSGSN